MKNELSGKIITKFVRLRANTYSYLIDDGSEDKRAKSTKICITKKQLKFENHQNHLGATQLENKINHLEKNNINIDSIKKNRKEFIRNNKLILKTQQRFKNERHNVFTEKTNKTALGSNYDKRMQSIFQ